jgi:ABC-2 type transport system ATP-binding protein
MNVIETHNLTKIYNNSNIALNGANLEVKEGAIFGLVGPNGAGKTTTIRLLLGLHKASAGTVKVFGEPMTPNATHLRQRIGFLPTNPQFPQDMNPVAYLDFVGKLFSLPTTVRKPRLAALLRAVGLLGATSQKIRSLSTGMTTRLGIAAALMNDPDLLILDEPTAGLDPEGRKYTLQLMQELGRQKTILVSSHDLTDLEKVCDSVGILSEGKLIFNGPIDAMKPYRRSNTLEIELEGDVKAFQAYLSDNDISWEQLPGTLRVEFPQDGNFTQSLIGLLQFLQEHSIKLLGIRTLKGDMVDAFIQLLEEERSHGFSRILELDALSRAIANGSSEPDALVGGADLAPTGRGADVNHSSVGSE